MSKTTRHEEFENWVRGRGKVVHKDETRQRIWNLLLEFDHKNICTMDKAVSLLKAADSLCNMGMWLTVHMTYARQVYLDGRSLNTEDFKENPEGHTGGALNMVPAYVGYLLANALSGKTRSWLMGQGHCVAAIDAVNILLGNVEVEQQQRYPLSDAGLSTLCQDFYGYAVAADGRPAVPLGSHVNAFTAGGISEGGYLGFADLQYVHMPLPEQELVTFLSDGAFEEQRGSDWAPRWWRGEDTGLVMPIMIANGRRIDQRSTMAQSGGVAWFRKHLQLYGFAPIDIDGRDPAAFAWAILSMAEDLQKNYQAIRQGKASYPVKLPYAIAETIKGYGFPGAGTNASHNLPLAGNPAKDDAIRKLFNEGATQLFIPAQELQQTRMILNNHQQQNRAQEKDHPLRKIVSVTPDLPALETLNSGSQLAPMEAIDEWFHAFIKSNPGRRFRIGNPDEMRSNRMNKTLDLLQHRVTVPESGIAESLLGSVITALNEETVVSAALANKQGISLVVSYEAFAVKMLGAMRQEIIFSRHLMETGRAPQWISVPVIVTSHTWENGKNEQSHQDPTLCETWLQEMEDVAPVYFPFDAPTAAQTMARIYGSRGKVATVVASKNKTPVYANAQQAKAALTDGAVMLSHDDKTQIQLLAIGAYQLQAVIRAAECLRNAGIACSVVAMVQPGRFRFARDKHEKNEVHSREMLEKIIPVAENRVVVTHTHAEIMAGVLRRIDKGVEHTRFMGYQNRGGTLDVFGMLYANQQTWAHVVVQSLELLGKSATRGLSQKQYDALSKGIELDVLR